MKLAAFRGTVHNTKMYIGELVYVLRNVKRLNKAETKTDLMIHRWYGPAIIAVNNTSFLVKFSARVFIVVK